MNAPLTRVLVVDDDPDIAVQIRSMLRQSQWAYDVRAESGGSDLPRRLSRSECDVWILDHHLTEKAGSELLASLPPDAERPPFVVLTMSLDPALSHTYLALGAADFLNKDELRPALLERTLRYAIAHDENRRNLDRQQEHLLRSERMATIGRIAAGVAHEYNNLHAVALGSLERLQRRVGDDPASERLLVRITESIQSSRRISESLFKLGQSNDLTGSIIDLQARVDDILSLMQHQAVKAGVQLEFNGIEGQAPVEMDGSDAQLVVSHLISNSIHAVHAVPIPRISVHLQRSEAQVVLAVTDNGVGIAPEDLSRVCLPFFSRKGPHDRDGLFPRDALGTGLGLAVCQSVIENAGGHLELSSRLGEGTTATVTLPIAAHAPATAAAPPLVASLGVDPERPVSVVVVDDNEQLCELLAEELPHHGLEVTTFTSPALFLAKITEVHLDALVLDWQMPSISGGEIIKRLGDHLRGAPLPVFIISGGNLELPSGIPDGVVIKRILAKPFRISELAQMLSNVAVRPRSKTR